MEPTTYTVRLPFDTLVISANLAEASSLVQYQDADGNWQCTPYQTADIGYGVREMARTVIDYLGDEYWADPSIITTDEDGDMLYSGMSKTDYIDSLIMSIEAE